ncbi:MAG: nickel pincer cofactor biosynthesis protein LarB [bacterium]
MNPAHIRSILEAVQQGTTGIDEALGVLKNLPYEDLGFAKLDHHRHIRRGFPEAVFCPGKSIEQIVSIAQRITATGSTLLATKAGAEIYEAIRAIAPCARYYPQARMIVVQKEPPSQKGHVLILSAGTADIPIAQEAAVTAEAHGSRVTSLFDVGVAGIHRLLSHQHLLDQARVIVVAAGMEGALASVVGGLVNKPVIAVPTSIGYGANFKGVAALLTMLNSCVGGVAVVNIDNGYSAGCIAHLINVLPEDAEDTREPAPAPTAEAKGRCPEEGDERALMQGKRQEENGKKEKTD